MEEVPVLVSVSGEVVSGNNGTHFDPMLGQTENQRCSGQEMRNVLRPPPNTDTGTDTSSACQQRIDFLLDGIELIQSQPRIRNNKGLAGFDVFVD
jgi:hypothetical protein